MARATSNEAASDDELPDLATLFPSRNHNHANHPILRQSPRKTQILISKNGTSEEDESTETTVVRSRETSTSPTKRPSTRKSPARAASLAKRPEIGRLGDIPILEIYGSEAASSKNSLARSPAQRSLGLAHVDSLLLPLSRISLVGNKGGKEARRVEGKGGRNGRMGVMSSVGESTGKSSTRTIEGGSRVAVGRKGVRARQFVLEEASCDDEDSAAEEDEDEDTDLSGFVVDDDADLSIHISSSDSDSEFESDVGKRKTWTKQMVSSRKRRLQRGRPKEKDPLESDTHDSNKENGGDPVSNFFRHMKIDDKKGPSSLETPEVIDLTSPTRSESELHINTSSSDQISHEDSKRPSEPANLFDDFDAILKFSPPHSYAPITVPTKSKITSDSSTAKHETKKSSKNDGFTTPPTTPPRSPSKLNSPSKLLSPSKKAAQLLKSPHRQSVDGFWDLEVVNTWNDTYSPKKAPLTSPKKNRLLIWSDSDNDDDDTPTETCSDKLSSAPSPCFPPGKPRSPLKSPEKAEKQRLADEKRAALAKKKEYEMKKETLAKALMQDLDANITDSNLSILSASTGGIQIIWSNTLRSTAGRANWRRTITKPSGSPIKDASPATVPEGCKVQHYASIELASKVIDSEARLVNTLAHEFCHLANFMVSNIRDQPHGASFKNWAARVTRYLRIHDVLIYRSVEVTTKHSYAINHKYLWACAGRELTDAQTFLNIPADGGCGAEYGRHSRSIDVERQRCGKCKGMLVQVRPKPRRVVEKQSPGTGGLFRKLDRGHLKGFDGVDVAREGMEIMELSD